MNPLFNLNPAQKKRTAQVAQLFVLAIVAFLVLDFLWYFLLGDFLKYQISSIVRVGVDGNWDVRLPASVAVYIVMALGIIVFVLPAATTEAQAAIYGAIFGFVMYGVHNLTNWAILTAWTGDFTLFDTVWGTMLSAAVSTLMYKGREWDWQKWKEWSGWGKRTP